MYLDEAFTFIEGAIMEYNDDRAYRRYLFDNLLAQLNNDPIGFLEYKERMGIKIRKEREINIDKVRKEANNVVNEVMKYKFS